ncbi:hypothetical protein ACO0LG_01805 [Undibacterium sp. Ji42W]|uniref:hypothetical protein n=1 Tax=Undibacterium sp. Ji42W TaxID=3413039 RepID=UPI003BF37A72
MFLKDKAHPPGLLFIDDVGTTSISFHYVKAIGFPAGDKSSAYLASLAAMGFMSKII